MTLDLLKDILAQEIESWKNFGQTLRMEDGKTIPRMLNQCYQFKESVNTKGDLYSTESLLISLIFLQHKIINSLILERLYTR
jgi:hypothetical protein